MKGVCYILRIIVYDLEMMRGEVYGGGRVLGGLNCGLNRGEFYYERVYRFQRLF